MDIVDFFTCRIYTDKNISNHLCRRYCGVSPSWNRFLDRRLIYRGIDRYIYHLWRYAGGGLVIGVEEDENHDLWITTKSGISRLDPAAGTFKNFNVHDGVQGMEFQSKSITKTDDGRIIAGGINGFNIFNPNDIDQASTKIRPFITSLRLFNNEVKAGDKVNDRILLKRSIANTKELVLHYNEGYIYI
jgi:hypothetical protein